MEKTIVAFLDNLEKTKNEILEKSASGEISKEEAHAALEHLNSLLKDATSID